MNAIAEFRTKHAPAVLHKTIDTTYKSPEMGCLATYESIQ